MRRTNDEPSMAGANPLWHALCSVIDTDLIAYLRHVLGQGRERLQDAA